MFESDAHRRAFLQGIARMLVVLGAGTLTCSTADAATHKNRPSPLSLLPFPLPSLGLTVPCSLSAANVPLLFSDGRIVEIDFTGTIM